MPIILNGDTINNGGTILYNGVPLSEVIFDDTQVWKKQQTFNGGSVNWNNINKNNSGYMSDSMDLRGFSTISFNLDGYFAYSAQSGWGAVSVRYSDGTLQQIVRWTSNTTFNTDYNITLTGTDAQRNGARIYGEGHITYDDATGVYNLLRCTCGSITAT